MSMFLGAIASKSDEFNSAKPYPHIVTDEIFSRGLLERLSRETPDDSYNWRHRKTSASDKWTLSIGCDAPESYLELSEYMQSDEIVDSIRELTGINDLFSDRSPRIIRVDTGGFLHVHTDAGSFKDNMYRAVNVLLYLNPEWNELWNGNFEMFDTGGELSKTVIPELGRTVIFLNSEKSWHGHPRRLYAENGRSRYAVQHYYFSNQCVGNNSKETYYIKKKKELIKINRSTK